MKKTYHGTLFHTTDLEKATVKIYLTEKPKYECTEADKHAEVEYTGVTSWDMILGGKEAEELEAETDGTCIDENHEYIVLHFVNGSTATFRNSHASMFIW